VPGLLGCTLTMVTDRLTSGVPVAYEATPVDAVAQVWFAETATPRFVIPSAAGAVTRGATAWRAEAHHIVQNEGGLRT